MGSVSNASIGLEGHRRRCESSLSSGASSERNEPERDVESEGGAGQTTEKKEEDADGECEERGFKGERNSEGDENECLATLSSSGAPEDAFVGGDQVGAHGGGRTNDEESKAMRKEVVGGKECDHRYRRLRSARDEDEAVCLPQQGGSDGRDACQVTIGGLTKDNESRYWGDHHGLRSICNEEDKQLANLDDAAGVVGPVRCPSETSSRSGGGAVSPRKRKASYSLQKESHSQDNDESDILGPRKCHEDEEECDDLADHDAEADSMKSPREGLRQTPKGDAGRKLKETLESADPPLSSKGRERSIKRDETSMDQSLAEMLERFGQIELNKDLLESIRRTESAIKCSETGWRRKDSTRAAFDAAVNVVRQRVLADVGIVFDVQGIDCLSELAIHEGNERHVGGTTTRVREEEVNDPAAGLCLGFGSVKSFLKAYAMTVLGIIAQEECSSSSVEYTYSSEVEISSCKLAEASQRCHPAVDSCDRNDQNRAFQPDEHRTRCPDVLRDSQLCTVGKTSRSRASHGEDLQPVVVRDSIPSLRKRGSLDEKLTADYREQRAIKRPNNEFAAQTAYATDKDEGIKGKGSNRNLDPNGQGQSTSRISKDFIVESYGAEDKLHGKSTDEALEKKLENVFLSSKASSNLEDERPVCGTHRDRTPVLVSAGEGHMISCRIRRNANETYSVMHHEPHDNAEIAISTAKRKTTEQKRMRSSSEVSGSNAELGDCKLRRRGAGTSRVGLCDKNVDLNVNFASVDSASLNLIQDMVELGDRGDARAVSAAGDTARSEADDRAEPLDASEYQIDYRHDTEDERVCNLRSSIKSKLEMAEHDADKRGGCDASHVAQGETMAANCATSSSLMDIQEGSGGQRQCTSDTTSQITNDPPKRQRKDAGSSFGYNPDPRASAFPSMGPDIDRNSSEIFLEFEECERIQSEEGTKEEEEEEEQQLCHDNADDNFGQSSPPLFGMASLALHPSSQRDLDLHSLDNGSADKESNISGASKPGDVVCRVVNSSRSADAGVTRRVNDPNVLQEALSPTERDEGVRSQSQRPGEESRENLDDKSMGYGKGTQRQAANKPYKDDDIVSASEHHDQRQTTTMGLSGWKSSLVCPDVTLHEVRSQYWPHIHLPSKFHAKSPPWISDVAQGSSKRDGARESKLENSIDRTSEASPEATLCGNGEQDCYREMSRKAREGHYLRSVDDAVRRKSPMQVLKHRISRDESLEDLDGELRSELYDLSLALHGAIIEAYAQAVCECASSVQGGLHGERRPSRGVRSLIAATVFDELIMSGTNEF